MDYQDAASKLGSKECVKIANNTYLDRLGEHEIGLRLHSTHVVTFRPDEMEFNTGGWYTVTTKDRLNYASGVRIFSERGEWFIATAETNPGPYYPSRADAVPFFNGIRVAYDGHILNLPPVS